MIQQGVIDGRCGDCRWWRRSASNGFRAPCMRFPPSVPTTQARNDHPYTSERDSCGEFMRHPQETKEG